MKKTLFAAAVGLWWLLSSMLAGPRDAQWKKVDEAVRAGLPKTAVEALDPIIAGALADGAHAEALKAIGRKISLEGSVQGGKAEEKIVRFEAELAKAPAELKPLMEALLAHWYWQYFRQNGWRFLQRTQTTASPGPDLRTWDLPRILAEIDRRFTAALADDGRLKAIPIADFDDLLPRGSVPDSYRPTLFDFIAHQALQFYQAGEQGATRSENEFELDAADSPVFADAAEFLAWQPRAADEHAPALKAIRILQKLLAFHRADEDRSAFLDADLARLKFAHNKAVGDEGSARYKAALRRFADRAAQHESSARALAELATLLDQQGERAGAHALASRGAEAFPDHAGGAMCLNLLQEIERQEATLTTERVWNPPWPTLDVTYRNVTRLHFRAVAVSFAEHLAQARWDPGQLSEAQRILLPGMPTALAWTADLPATTDYRQRTERLPAPTSLKPGFYFIVASADETFSGNEAPVTMVGIWVSTLALVTGHRADSSVHGGFVLDARTGEPIDGATVWAWQRDREGWFRPAGSTQTDEHGRFEIGPRENGVVLMAEHRGQQVTTLHPLHAGRPPRERGLQTETVFFTDRALYRPGQAIHYKGISFRHDGASADYATVARQHVTVVFKDPNGKEIARARHETNDYGSFSGVFTAPRDRLMGRMTLQAIDGSRGATAFNVEEYKRPKFRVEMAAPAEAPKLGTPVTLAGKAVAYTGAAIGGATVAWRVERSVRLPLWCWWWHPPATQAIAHGTALTEPDGTFKIRFTAVPDRSVPEADEPVFVFTAHADVTDTSGETRSEDRMVSVGYTALQASLAAAEWQTPRRPVELSIATSALDGEPEAVSGTVVVHALQQPATVQRAPLESIARWRSGGEEARRDASDPETWTAGAEVARRSFQSDASGAARVTVPLPVGIYRASLQTEDRFGRKVTARHTVRVIAPTGRRFGIRQPDFFTAMKWSVEPDETFTALWGTGYETGRAFVEVECNGRVLQSYWTEPGLTQDVIEQDVTEDMRGGFTVRVTSVHENRAYLHERIVDVPWSNKQLAIKWESFRSKLMPGQKETWTAVLTGPGARRAAGEMVAALYDASLDLYAPHAWPGGFPVFRREYPRMERSLHNSQLAFHAWRDVPRQGQLRPVDWSYRGFPPDFVSLLTGGVFASDLMAGAAGGVVQLSPFTIAAEREGYAAATAATAAAQGFADSGGAVRPAPAEAEAAKSTAPDLTKVTARKNLNETAFFFPHLVANRQGEVRMTFTMPEALTEWRFLGFAHDRQLRSGFVEARTVTAKDLMVQPNPPRFVREGDAIEFTVKVSNQSDQPQSGTVRLTFADAATLESADAALGQRERDQAFSIPAKQSRSYSWRIAVPDGMGFLAYKAVATTSRLSDGEEGFLPVLSRRILVTESLPLPVRGPGVREFEFAKLAAAGRSDTLRHQGLTVQMTSQPAWNAVLALPYLMEFPHECTEQIFNRFYANALARHIAGSDPKIRRIFDLWKNTAALDSPLEKNADLKSVLLEETPWLRHAKRESEARRNVGLLFDASRLEGETAATLRVLGERQLGEGLWPWFPGGRPNEFISLYIAAGFGRLRHLGVTADVSAALKSLAGLDAWMHARYERITDRGGHVPGPLDALYLYGRSFFLGDRAINPAHKEAADFYLSQARKFWLQAGNRQSQAHLAIALQRFGDAATARQILQSLRERSVTDPELGMFWRDAELSWWWYHAPIETQALMIEAFAEVADDARAVEDCKVWLLKQKQLQDWKTTKATADAVYALLLRGEKLLASDARVDVALGGTRVQPERTEAGTGFYEKKFFTTQVTPAMGRITVTKPDAGVSWGSVHWQYLEDVAKITPHAATPLTIRKALFVRENSSKGRVLRPVTEAVSVGDELVVRLELRTDRDMEYLHLKDQRGSGTEPVNVISRHRWQDGLAYYESTRDTASHFFIDYLPKGTYVFEYSTRVQLKGRYQSGIAEIQCMYAPEFNSHSESIAIDVR